jgi:glucose-6-phosphate isomerase
MHDNYIMKDHMDLRIHGVRKYITDELWQKLIEHTEHAIHTVSSTITQNQTSLFEFSQARYQKPFACVHVPFDTEQYSVVEKLVSDVRLHNPTMVIVVGIGGSSLGAQAVLSALRGVLAHEHDHHIPVYFADTIDTDYSADLASIMVRELARGGTAILNIVSKTGTTMETIANAAIFIEIMREYQSKNYQQCIVVTTDAGSPLWQYAIDYGYARLAVPEVVGGRFSVFTTVGLLPLALAGIDCRALLQGAQEGMRNALIKNVEHNHAALNALLICSLYEQGATIYDSFIFSADLADLGAWYRQLFAESLGKLYRVDGKPMRFGMLPTISIGPNDLHSVAQFYCGGLYPAYTRFIRIAHMNIDMHVPIEPAINVLVSHIQGKSLTTLMDAVITGVKQTYDQRCLPYSELVIPEKSPMHIGYFLQSAMLEVIYVGLILGIDPFDQPDVVYYKQETRKILTHE